MYVGILMLEQIPILAHLGFQRTRTEQTAELGFAWSTHKVAMLQLVTANTQVSLLSWTLLFDMQVPETCDDLLQAQQAATDQQAWLTLGGKVSCLDTGGVDSRRVLRRGREARPCYESQPEQTYKVADGQCEESWVPDGCPHCCTCLCLG